MNEMRRFAEEFARRFTRAESYQEPKRKVYKYNKDNNKQSKFEKYGKSKILHAPQRKYIQPTEWFL